MALPKLENPSSAGVAIKVYECPTTTPTKTRAVVSVNVAATSKTTVKLHLVPPGGSAGNANLIEPGQALAPDTVPLERTGIALTEGWSIWASSSVASAANVHVWGIEGAA